MIDIRVSEETDYNSLGLSECGLQAYCDFQRKKLMHKLHPLLLQCWQAAIKAALPAYCLPPYLPEPPKGRTVVIGVGKGAAQLACQLDQHWSANYPRHNLSGVVVTRYGYATKAGRIAVMEAAHPVPDQAGIRATESILHALHGLSTDDLVIALICGGGSALLPAPPEGLTLADEVVLNQMLLASGMPIGGMNTIRKHVSRVKGGRLALACEPAKLLSLIASDVPGDDPAAVASGVTIANEDSRSKALYLIDHYRLELPDMVMQHLHSAAADCPSPDHPYLQQQKYRIIASARISLQAAAEAAQQAGVTAHILSDALEGEAATVAHIHAAIARNVLKSGQPFAAPALILSGGEVTVRLNNQRLQMGGPNAEFALALSQHIADQPITALIADSDGIDGNGDHAGAYVDGQTLSRLQQARIDVNVSLAHHQSYASLDLVGALFKPGPTGTNVNDFRAILVG